MEKERKGGRRRRKKLRFGKGGMKCRCKGYRERVSEEEGWRWRGREMREKNDVKRKRCELSR